ncbi:lytic transglycosylase domain-containing protein [uncultured Endozoicomonas sp.]|uniref:lytic transglycosylase domain-containing protein n=1 Tax=uncultured Endozoicomonas sp. TaxID=432652 RepID=UPI002604397F|nr:lytic transglycosylase domain-containing protein [uncultured Endozoicomonas sp.]
MSFLFSDIPDDVVLSSLWLFSFMREADYLLMLVSTGHSLKVLLILICDECIRVFQWIRSVGISERLFSSAVLSFFIYVTNGCCSQVYALQADLSEKSQWPKTISRPVCLKNPGDGWQSLRYGFELAEHYDAKRVKDQLQAFPQYYFNRHSNRIQSYQQFIILKVQERGLPSELALLPLIESELNLNAHSSARAKGLWQLMPRTARAYGLEVSILDDERVDLEKSTAAALDYIQDVHGKTNDWLLTFAAYNAGLYRVKKLVNQSKQNYTLNGFWVLDLPGETRRHVAKLLALSQIVRRPDDFGIRLPRMPIKDSGLSSAKLGNHHRECVIPAVHCLFCRWVVLFIIYAWFQAM